MTADVDGIRFVHTIRQKLDAEGKPLPIWSWRLQQGSVTVAFGERGSEQQAMSAAQAAKRNFGAGLDAVRS